MEKAKLPKRAGSVGLALFWDWMKNWAWTLVPTVPTAFTFLNISMQKFPIWLGVLVSSIVFWAIISGLAAARSFWAKSTVYSKLVAPGLKLGHGVDENGNINRLNIGLNLTNISELLIQYEVLEVRSVLDGRVNPAPVYENMGAILQPACETAFWDAPVPLTLTDKQIIEGSFDIKIAYGKAGAMKHRMNLSYKIVAKALTPAKVETFMWFTK